GFSFLKNTIATTEAAHYIDGPDYTDIFATEQLNQWQSSCNVAVKAQRVTKPSITSLYTGT
ncbi:hypothetical protein KZ874_34650, partial [Pseudomonas aeruginosa]|uniref:hypothetical protein n=1 Tax=Pseudomonas aeruginosa TaxID=287 RepID=UPI001CA471FC